MVFKAGMDVFGAWHILVQCDSVVNSGDLTRETGRTHPVKKKLLRTCGKSSVDRPPPHLPLAIEASHSNIVRGYFLQDSIYCLHKFWW